MKEVIAQRDDVAFFMKMFPLMSLHPQAYDKSLAIMCQDDNEKSIALLEEVYAGKNIGKPSCQSDSVKRSLALGKKLNITSTPLLIYMDGTQHKGALSADNIIKIIDIK